MSTRYLSSRLGSRFSRFRTISRSEIVWHHPSMAESLPATDQPLFYSTGDFAALTRLSVPTVQRMCDRGLIAHIVVSDRGDRRIPASELDRLLAAAEASRGAQAD